MVAQKLIPDTPAFPRDFVNSARCASPAAPVCSQQRAPRRWLIGPPEGRTHCRIAIISDHFPLDLSRPKRGQPHRNFAVLKSLTRQDPRRRRSLLVRFRIRRTWRRGSRRPSNVAQFVCSDICREYRSYRVSDCKIAVRCPDVPRDQVKCRQSPDYHDLTISSGFSATDQPGRRSALLTPNLARL